MTDNWIPVREQLPTDEDWKIVQTQTGVVYPASYINQKWVPLFRGGLVEQLLHGKVVYWQDTPKAYPYVQCKCGAMYLQAEGRMECPICASFHIEQKAEPKQERRTRKPKEEPKVEEIPFAEEEDDLALLDEDI